ncbi:Uncharacterised protein [Bordetella pertussis]|nr:Uncharacterised protein [Bordetella pertussis]
MSLWRTTQLRFAGHRRQQRDAAPAHRGLGQHDEVIAGQHRLHGDFDRFPALVGQRPAHFVLRVVEAERAMRGQFLRRFGRAMALQVGGACHQGAAGYAQMLDHQLGIGIQLGAHAQGQVHPLPDHVHPPVGDQQLHRYRRPGVEEFRQQRRQHLLGNRHRATDHHRARGRGLQLPHGVLGRTRGRRHFLAVVQVAFAGRGQAQAARRALQQAHPQPVLQLRDAARQAGFRDIEHPRCRTEAALLDDLGEVVEVVEILHENCSKFRTNSSS